MVDRLTRTAHFNPTRETWSVPGLADEFLADGRYHEVLGGAVSDLVGCFTDRV